MASMVFFVPLVCAAAKDPRVTSMVFSTARGVEKGSNDFLEALVDAVSVQWEGAVFQFCILDSGSVVRRGPLMWGVLWFRRSGVGELLECLCLFNISWHGYGDMALVIVPV
jgi:hypothetical protein